MKLFVVELSKTLNNENVINRVVENINNEIKNYKNELIKFIFFDNNDFNDAYSSNVVNKFTAKIGDDGDSPIEYSTIKDTINDILIEIFTDKKIYNITKLKKIFQLMKLLHL